MDGNRFDDLTRTLAGEDGARVSRRVALKGAAAGLLAALGVGKAAGAQVTQAQCGNKICKNNPGLCGDACVCCVYANGNSRCRPPGTCSPGTALCPPDRPVLDSSGLCVAAPGGCSGPADCEDGDPCTTNLCNQGECVTGFVGDGQQGGCGTGRVCFAGGCVDLSCSANGDCWSGICQGETCVATVAGTCTGPSGTCGNGLCACIDVAGTTTCAEVVACIAPGATADVCQMVEPNSTFFASGAWCTGGPGCALGPCPPFPRHCFTGETRIAMADGTSRPIELVAVGDYVLGQGGINRVEAIMRPLLGSKPLYALNDGPFFVTAEHPFLTDTGWKAINPSESEAENPRLVVGRLAVGNRLLALAGVPVLAGGGNAMETVIPELTAVAVEQIRETRADPATQLYNLRLDGDHTYLANDLVVHNK